jgi:hypothetical protein
MAIQLRYASEDEAVVQDRKHIGMPTAIGVSCWMIAIFILALTLLT